MKVCIIGCTGYLGSAIAEYLFKKKIDVVGVCRTIPKNKPFKNSFYKLIKGDIREEKTQKKIISSKSNIVIYTVSLNHSESEKSLKHSISVNFLPLTSLVNKLIKTGNVKKFLYFSTMQVYGNYSDRKIVHESVPRNNKNIYALTHSMCEDYLLMINNSSYLQTISLRLSNGYGYPELDSCDCWWLVANDFCLSAVKKEVINLKSDGSPLRDFLHITDVALAVEKIIKHKGELPECMNLASGKTFSMLEIAQKVKKINKKKGKEIQIFIKDKKVTDKYMSKKINEFKNKKKFLISNKNMKNLGIYPKVSLNDGLKNTLESLEANIG